MQSRIPRWRSSSLWLAALGVVASVTACDAEQAEDGTYLRSWDGQDAAGGDAPSSSLEQIEGGVIVACPECGNHWTIVDGETVAVFLDARLGARILSLASEGTFRRARWRGRFDSYQEGPADGYTIEIEPFAYASEKQVLEPLEPEDAVLRVVFDGVFVDVGLKYVDNEAAAFGTPSSED